jgi:hypothetical protein
MVNEGAEKVKVSKYTGENGFNIAGEYVPNFVSALRKLATDAVITVEDAEFALKTAAEKGNFSFWVVEPEKYQKVAARLSVAEEKEAGVPKGLKDVAAAGRQNPTPTAAQEYARVRGGANQYGKKLFEGSFGSRKYKREAIDTAKAGGGPIALRENLERGIELKRQAKEAAEGSAPKKEQAPDPAQQAMDQMQMAQMQQPQGPSPVDMAVAEQMQSIQSQMQALTQMQQLVQTIQQRASMIASGGGAGAAPAAAAAAMAGPMDPSMMGAGAAVPGMPGGQPPPQGQPGMDPNAQQAQGQPGMPPGQDPNAQQAQGQPGQDPNAQQQPPPPPSAMMASDDGSTDTMQQQVNPQFIEQAGQLNDAGTFDAAALSSMAQTPSLKEMVAGYLPNLEKSLDNLGRVLLTLWMDEMRIKGDIGDDAFISLEDNLRSTFRGMGDLILKINQNTLILRDQNDHSVYQG